MKNNNRYQVLLLLLCTFVLNAQNSGPKGLDFLEGMAYEKEVRRLLQKMTLEEKIGQLNQYTGNWQATGPVVRDTSKFTQIKKGMVGSMLNIKTVERTRELQEYAMQSRLKIPLLFGLDVVHGLRTIFPIPLAEAASFDLGTIQKSAEMAALETSASGVHWTFAPMVDVSRDARWGRVMEGAGEDAWYGAQVAAARVRGFQGDDLSSVNTIMACAKHFAAYGAPVAGKDYNTVDMSLRNLHLNYLPPFEAAVDAGVGTFMNGFNDLNGIPVTGNAYLLREILKEKWYFNGFVVSDWGSIGEMIAHGYAKDRKEAAEKAIRAGTDMDMESRSYIHSLKELVTSGEVPEAYVDEAAARILHKKYELGLFEDPFKYCNQARQDSLVMHPIVREAALDMAKKSMVLLKNDQTLPLSKQKIQRIALIGPLMQSKKDMPGFWANEQYTDSVVTILQGFKNHFPDIEITYADGYDLATNSEKDVDKAVELARASDVAIVAVGERWDWSGEAKSRADFNIPDSHTKLVGKVKAVGKPVIVLVMGGRPLIFNTAAEKADAVLMTWWLGTEAGNAIAQVLKGDYNPSGKLPMTFPAHIGQVPIYYNYKNTGRPENPEIGYSTRYQDIDFTPAYPFGYGLSYTTFEYGEVTLSASTMRKDGKVTASTTLSNTGAYDGEEVVQLYIRDRVSSFTRPIKELKGFKKVWLASGDTTTVTFEITPKTLQGLDEDLNPIVESGEFQIMIGSSSAKLKTTTLMVE